MARTITGRASAQRSKSGSVIYSKTVEVNGLHKKLRASRPFLRVPKQGFRGKKLNRNKSSGGMGG